MKNREHQSSVLTQSDFEKIESIIAKHIDDIAVSVGRSFTRLEKGVDAVESRVNVGLRELEAHLTTVPKSKGIKKTREQRILEEKAMDAFSDLQSQKQALLNALAYTDEAHELSSEADKKAVRAALVIQWLKEIHWDDEADDLEHRMSTSPQLSEAFAERQKGLAGIEKYLQFSSLLICVYGSRVANQGWKARHGAPLVEELWSIINMNHENV